MPSCCHLHHPHPTYSQVLDSPLLEAPHHLHILLPIPVPIHYIPTTLLSSTCNLSNCIDLISYYHYINPPFSPPKSTATSNTGKKKIKPAQPKNMLRELNTQDVSESRKLYLAKKIQSRVSHDENTTFYYIYTQHQKSV